MKLNCLLEGLEYKIVRGTVDCEVSGIACHSAEISKGSLFVCIRGLKTDGHIYAKEAVSAGAAVLIMEREDVYIPKEAVVVIVKNTREALARISAAFFGHPAEKLVTIGITGTKGKTTTAYMIRSILEQAGYKTGLIGTIETINGEKEIPNENTTPESCQIQKSLYEMVQNKCQCVVMEVSSQGLKYHRVDGILFDYGIFTNIEPDHIGKGEHKDFQEYLHCKSLLFQKCRVGIVNRDDRNIDAVLKGHTCKIVTFGMSEEADICGVNMELFRAKDCLGVSFTVSGEFESRIMVDIPGIFSVYNALAAITLGSRLRISLRKMKKALAAVKVKGRVERVETGQDYTILIDYAHNAMSLKSLLNTLREYEPKRLICLFGCGGNRSKYRRLKMGEVSAGLADLTVVTSDNPRDEEPMEIIDDILEGVKKGGGDFYTICDRRKAIEYCIRNAGAGDVIVLAGKGHEIYQEIRGKKYEMDERKIIREIYDKLRKEKMI